MRQELNRPFSSYVDVKAGTIAREIFSDQAIYEMELERIFARAWNFMCHESQIPNKGDFFLSFIGEESVICTRDKTNTFQVFINSCRHRGNAVCRAESGNARSFLCTYHGWTFGLDGKLIGVPGYKDLYHEDLDREQWGLIPAGKVQSYKGFIFATMDPEAPDLADYLGPVARLALDMAAGRGAARGGMVSVDGVQKNQIGANWKLPVDNLFDWYHVGISHASALLSGGLDGATNRDEGRRPGDPNDPQSLNTQRTIFGEYGHAIGGPRYTPEFWKAFEEKDTKLKDVFAAEAYRTIPEVAAEIGELGRDTRGHPNIFPNLWITQGGNQLCLRLPKGPTTTELWWFTLIPADASEKEHVDTLRRANHVFGPAGILEQDDGENWDQSTRATLGHVARKYPFNFQMNFKHGPVEKSADGLSYTDGKLSEHGQFWTWRAWADWMDATSWADLRKHHTLPPAAGELI